MANQVFLLVLGFVLTTVVGGFLGFYYQRRTWDANRRESERTAAASVFDEISRAMDERLYRMRLVYWGIKQGNDERIVSAMGKYREALFKWNDNLNRNLALAYRYFGRDVWAFLSGVLYEEFAIIGRHLEGQVRHRGDPAARPGHADRPYVSGRRLQALSNDIYDLNRFIISMIQRGWVGLYLGERREHEGRPWTKDLSFGSKSTQVVFWQRDLVRAGHGPLEVDGWFGQATSDATKAFQDENGLDADGVVHTSTRSKMAEVVAAAS
ncbi:MAG TPA: peptidoglycan-binding domain-containing protein [Actinomycetota bacterium]|nr:peptidoglycan-binding domain-containing protein [Actinomycetota bacterium]